MVAQTSDNKFGVAQWIVDPVAGLGTHTTIQGAINSASSGETIFLRPGTYTEDITLKAGLTITSFIGESDSQNVILQGKVAASYSGASSLNNVRLQTNGDFGIEITGANATVLQLNYCFMDGSDNTFISSTCSNAASSVTCDTCNGDIGTTGITFFSWGSPGSLILERCKIGNSGNSTTASTASSGFIAPQYCILFFPITTSGTAQLDSFNTFYSTAGTNTVTMTVGGSGSNASNGDQLFPGTATAVVVTSNLTARNSLYSSSNANIVSGAGTFTYTNIYLGTGTGTLAASVLSGASTYTGMISFDGGVNLLDYYESDAWTPVIAFGGGSTGITYTTQVGSYTRIGKFVHAQCQILLSSKGTDTGAATITGLPFAAAGNSVGTCTWGLLDLDAAGGYYYVSANLASTAQVLTLQENGDNVAIAALTDADFSATSSITISIQYMVA